MDQILTVLIADDESTIRNGLKNIVEQSHANFRVIGLAKNGQEALQLLQNNPPDLAIIDINMPIYNGLEVIEQSKQWKLPTQYLILSGYNEFEYAQSALRFGVKNYFLKPLNIPEFCLELQNQYVELTHQKDLYPYAEEDTNLDNDVIKSAKAYIRQHIKENIRAKDVAHHVAFSESYFTIYFKSKTGVNFRDYLLGERIALAKELLKKQELSINEIGYQVGYIDYRSFTRAFKNATGMSPSRYVEVS